MNIAEFDPENGSMYVVCLSLSTNENGQYLTSILMSWTQGDRDRAIGHAMEAAKEKKPGYGVDQYLVTEFVAKPTPREEAIPIKEPDLEK